MQRSISLLDVKDHLGVLDAEDYWEYWMQTKMYN